MRNEISDLKENQNNNLEEDNTLFQNQKQDLKQDFNKDQDQEANDTTKEKESNINFIFSGMILLVVVGTIQIILNINKFLGPLKKNNPKYEFPSIYDFKITLIALPIFCV